MTNLYFLCFVMQVRCHSQSIPMGAPNSTLIYHESLGGGANGEVFRATWQRKSQSEIEVAAKKISFSGEIPDHLRREMIEREDLRKLDHTNITRYYGTMIQEQHAVIITEYAAKGSLFDYLKDKTKLPKKLLHLWMFQLAKGIDYLSQNGITHHNLKSSNCMITTDGKLKIRDFGMAKDFSGTTKTNWKGSTRWLAPEVIKDQELSPKAEIFAFAIIVWEMLTCEAPYSDKTEETVMHEVCYKDLRPAIPTECPTFLKDLMERCWHEDRQMRPASSDIVKMLQQEYRFTDGYGKTL